MIQNHKHPRWIQPHAFGIQYITIPFAFVINRMVPFPCTSWFINNFQVLHLYSLLGNLPPQSLLKFELLSSIRIQSTGELYLLLYKSLRRARLSSLRGSYIYPEYRSSSDSLSHWSIIQQSVTAACMSCAMQHRIEGGLHKWTDPVILHGKLGGTVCEDSSWQGRLCSCSWALVSVRSTENALFLGLSRVAKHNALTHMHKGIYASNIDQANREKQYPCVNMFSALIILPQF